MVGQFQEASGAMEAMANSSGELRESYATYMESAEAHINQLKAAFESLAQSLFDSDSIKTVVDLLAGLLTVLDVIVRNIGGIPTIITGIAAALSGFKNIGIMEGFGKLYDRLEASRDTATFSISKDFRNQLNDDVVALRAFQKEIASGTDKVVAIDKAMKNASVNAKNYATNTEINSDNIKSFVISEKSSQVAMVASSKSFKDQVSLIKAYKNNLRPAGLSQEQFRDAVGQTNPKLADYLSKVEAGKASTLGYTASLVKAKVAAIALKTSTVLLNIAFTALASMAVSAIIYEITKAANAASKGLSEAADSANELSESVKTLGDYKDRIIELRKELDNSGLSIEDVTKKREELFNIQKQLITNYGNEASRIDFVNGSIEEQIELYDRLKVKKAERWTNDHTVAIHDARKFLYEDDPDFLTQYLKLMPENEGFSIEKDLFGKLTGVSKFLFDWAERTSNATWQYTGNNSMQILLNGGRLNIVRAYDDLSEKLREYEAGHKNLTEQEVNNIEALKLAISGAKKYVTDNSMYDDSVQTYMQGVENVAQTDSAYKVFYDNITEYQKEYNDAIIRGSDKAIEDSYNKVKNAYKSLFNNADFSRNHNGVLGDDVKLWYEEQYKEFQNLSMPIRLKIDIEGTKQEFDSSYEKLVEIYAKVGDEGFSLNEDDVDALGQYNQILKIAKAFGVDLSNLNKVVYGNIDMSNRQVLEWTDENLNKFKDAYESLGWTSAELEGSISTVMGMVDEFDGVNIAFTPMLQTDHGAVLLDENTVYEYVWALIDQMPEEWTNEDLLKLDARGIEMDGQKIKGLIADIGETAIKTSESMHFAGKDGAIADAYKYWQEYVKENNLSNISVDQASEFNAIRDAAKEAGVSIESYVDALVRYGKVRKATSSTTEELSITKYAESIKTAQDAISPLLDAYNKLQKGEMSSVDIVSLISDKFPSLIKYTDNLSLGVQKLASAKLDEIKKSLEGIDKDKLSENDLKAYKKFIEYIDNINDKFHSNLAYLEKIQTNSKNVMDVITTLISLKNEINKYGSLSESSIDKVMSNESLVLLRPYLNDVKSMMPIINNLISEQKQAYEDLYNEQQRLIDTDTYMEASQQKQKEDENAFQNNLKRINDQVEKFKEKYGVDLSNWDKISDGKKEILKNTNAELLSKQLKLINDFSNYYNIDLKNFKNATEAKAAILKQFRDSEALAQASQIAVEKGWLHNYQGNVLLDGAEAIKEIGNLLQPLGLTVDDFTQYLTNGNFSYATDKRLTEQLNEILNAYTITPATWDEMLRDSGGSGSGSAASKRKTWFEQQYDDHNHLVKMEKETEKDYLDWLNNAYKQAYSQGIIDLDAYYKYEEEVYNGRKKLTGEGTYWFEKEYKEHQHRLKMETEDEEAYLKWLDQAYKRAYSEGRMTLDDYRKYEEEVYTGLKKLFEKQYQLHQHYLKMETEDEADYLKWLNEAYKQAYRQGLLSLEDYRKYQEEVYEGVKKLKDNAESAIKSLVDIRINMLKEDVSKEKESIDKRLKNLKDFYDKQKEMLQDKHDQEKYLEDQAEKRKKVSDIQAKIAQLRFDDSANAQKKRVELQKELVDAQKELNSFESDYAFDQTKDHLDKLYEQQEKAAEERKEVLDKTVSSPQELYEQALNDIRNGSQNLYGQMIEWNNLYGDGIRDTIKKAWEEAYKAEKQYFNYTGTHFNGVNLSNATGYVKGVSGYASGTSHAIAGIHKVDEQGVETIFQSADGQRYRMFSSGEKVLNASASDFLYKFANKGREILDKLFNGTSHSYNNVVPGVVANNIQLGDIVIQGNADKSTVSEIRRAQRENLEQMLKQLNRLK